MNVFQLREAIVQNYASYVRSFIQIKDDLVREQVDKEMAAGLLWPEPLIQLNPSFEPGRTIDELVQDGVLHRECGKIFRVAKSDTDGVGRQLRLYRHQEQAILRAREGSNYVLTTGTGSGKSMAYIVPIVDRVLRIGSGGGIKAIVVYPMNALANSQRLELEKFLCAGYPEGQSPVTFERYTGQESLEEKDQIIENPPDILLTNFVMLELILTRLNERRLIQAAQGLRFLVLDELHTYRGRQGADVALLVRRVREYMGSEELQCVGTSATLATEGSGAERQEEIAKVTSSLFGAPVEPEDVIGETLRRTTDHPDQDSPSFTEALKRRLSSPDTSPQTYGAFRSDPLAMWVESQFGVRRANENGQLVRAIPTPIQGDNGAASDLSRITGAASLVPRDSGTNTTVGRDPDPTSTDMMITDASISNQPPRACDVSPANLAHECAIRASRPSFLARKQPFAPICVPNQEIWACILAGAVRLVAWRPSPGAWQGSNGKYEFTGSFRCPARKSSSTRTVTAFAASNRGGLARR